MQLWYRSSSSASLPLPMHMLVCLLVQPDEVHCVGSFAVVATTAAGRLVVLWLQF
jgi:hypothetical protein